MASDWAITLLIEYICTALVVGENGKLDVASFSDNFIASDGNNNRPIVVEYITSYGFVSAPCLVRDGFVGFGYRTQMQRIVNLQGTQPTLSERSFLRNGRCYRSHSDHFHTLSYCTHSA